MPITIESVITIPPPTAKTLYESNSNTNAFTDAEKAKLADLLAVIISVAATPSNYSPAGSSVEQHLAAIDIALASPLSIGGPYDSDEDAGIGGVVINGLYELTPTNIYGIPTGNGGVLKRRKE